MSFINVLPKIQLFQKFILLVLLTLLCALLLGLNPALSIAQEASPTAQTVTVSTEESLPPTISPISPIYTDMMLHNLMHSASCLMIGQSVIAQPCLTYKLTQDSLGALKSVPVLSQTNTTGGFLGTLGSLLDGVYQNPPVASSQYLATLPHELQFAKPVHAQGSGEAVLEPVIRMWQVSRNISYILMVVIFVVVGLMVMFRNKINPQTVITAQAALPGLIIGLFLITFSYFLAGFITDFAFIGTNLVGYFFSYSQTPDNPVVNLVEKTKDQNVLTMMSQLSNNIFDVKDPITNALSILFDEKSGFQGQANVLVRTGLFLTAFQIISPLGSGAGSLFSRGNPLLTPVFEAFGGLIGGGIAGLVTAFDPPAVLGFVFTIIVLIAVIVTMVRLLMKLVQNYLSIVFLTITAPFHFLAASLPGRQGIATDWVRNMFCNVLSFPAVAAVLYFAYIMLGTNSSSSVFAINTTTEIAGNTTLPLLGGLQLSFVRILLALGAIFATPSIPDLVCKVIGKASQAEQLIGQGFSAGIKGGQQYLGRGQAGLGAVTKSGFQTSDLLKDQQEWVHDPAHRKMILLSKGTKLQQARGTAKIKSVPNRTIDLDKL